MNDTNKTKSLAGLTVRLSGIVEDSITDGPGLRTAIFTQGCSQHCDACQNKHTWDFNGGKDYSLDYLFSIIVKNPLLSGVTFSGGEPFEQIEKLLPLILKLKSETTLDIAIYTGYGYDDLLKSKKDATIIALHNIDTVIDGRFVLAERNLNNRFKGSDNQRIIDVQKSLTSGKTVLDSSTRWN